ncbi:hypothetical protein AB1Y20_014134 [Prymnesium parvum]|uniref:Cysteine-rich DPF motif domain-containing protein 1 n=1 Tax=Prymnesium parvum TaxID=97485 RepID=A0AB34IHA6_PRYPA
MGKDVFGQERFGCTQCACSSYESQISSIPPEQLHEIVPHHPRNSPAYVHCTCGHSVAQHLTHADRAAASMPAAAAPDQPLLRCPACQGRPAACRQPGGEGHLRWAEAYCPKCFTKPNPRGCKKLDDDGHWDSAALAAARAAVAPPLPADAQTETQ